MKTILETSNEIHAQIWNELCRASLDRHHEWRTPVMATSTKDSTVNARTVVLRHVSRDEELIEIYTDSRSSKFTELSQNSSAQFVFWSTRLNWQLRVRTECKLLSSGSYVDSLWQNVKQSPSSGDYFTPTAPGTAIDSVNGRVDPKEKNKEQKNYFAVISCKVTEIDWLELSRVGHRRAMLKDKQWQWLVP
jgi:hypothetical protein